VYATQHHAAQRGVTMRAQITQTDLLTARECADYWRCSLRTLDRERELGNGCPYVRIGGRIYYRRGDVDQFIAAHVCGGDRVRSSIATKSPSRRRPRKIPTDVHRRLDQLTGALPHKAAP
jgi:hypothetical protein